LLLGNFLNRQPTERKIRIDGLVLVNGGFKTLENALSVFAPIEIWVDWKPVQEKHWKETHPNGGPKLVNYRAARYREI
jgi:hypothetical protein